MHMVVAKERESDGVTMEGVRYCGNRESVGTVGAEHNGGMKEEGVIHEGSRGSRLGVEVGIKEKSHRRRMKKRLQAGRPSEDQGKTSIITSEKGPEIRI